MFCPCTTGGLSANLEIGEVNKLLHAVDARLDALMLDQEKLDPFKHTDAHRALEAQIRALKDQQRMLAKRWNELTQDFGLTEEN